MLRLEIYRHGLNYRWRLRGKRRTVAISTPRVSVQALRLSLIAVLKDLQADKFKVYDLTGELSPRKGR